MPAANFLTTRCHYSGHTRHFADVVIVLNPTMRWDLKKRTTVTYYYSVFVKKMFFSHPFRDDKGEQSHRVIAVCGLLAKREV